MINELAKQVHKFRPILFSTPMVQAIQEGRKTMTRRKFKPKDEPYLINEKSFIAYSDSHGWGVKHKIGDNPDRFEITQKFKCPYGKVGDVLWVRETWKEGHAKSESFRYRATYDFLKEVDKLLKWKPSIFMPKAACRIFLEITDIKIERLQDISEDDAIAEGILIDEEGVECWDYEEKHFYDTPIDSFQSLWQSINGAESWEANPFVWVIEFEQITKPLNFK